MSVEKPPGIVRGLDDDPNDDHLLSHEINND